MGVKVQNHPDLVQNWDKYTAIADFTDGARDRVLKYLIRYDSEADGTPEGEKQYQGRLRRLYNINFCDPPLTIHWAHMSQSITINGLDGERLEEIQNDVTGYRQDYLQAARDRLWFYQRDGRVGTLVDGPETVAENKEQERIQGDRSYQVIYEAKCIRYWEYFRSGPRKGQLRVLVLEDPSYFDGERYAEQLRRFEQPEGDVRFEFQILRSRESYATQLLLEEAAKDYEVVRQGAGGLNAIPFVLAGSGPEESFLKDVWPLNLVHMNKKSVLSNIIYNQGFQRSFVAGVKKEQVSKMAEWLITILDSPDVSVFTIDPGNPEAAQTEVANLERQMDRRGKFEHNQLSDDTRQVQSAESKAKDLIARTVIYDNTLDRLADVEEQIYRFHAEFEGANTDDITVSIAREYGLEDEETKNHELDMVFDQARELGVTELQKEILRIRAAKLRFLPTDDETEEEVRDRVMEAIAAAEAPAQSRLGGFMERFNTKDDEETDDGEEAGKANDEDGKGSE